MSKFSVVDTITDGVLTRREVRDIGLGPVCYFIQETSTDVSIELFETDLSPEEWGELISLAPSFVTTPKAPKKKAPKK